MDESVQQIAAVDEKALDHSPFAALLPSRRKQILETVCERMPFPVSLITSVTDLTDRTYVTVERGDTGEWVTYLVAFGDRVHFENGHYGFRSELMAFKDMYRRANR